MVSRTSEHPFIDVDAENFTHAIKAALGFAAKGMNIHVIEAVRIERVRDHLVVVGTDRFVLGALTVPIKDSASVREDWTFTVSREDAEDIVRAYTGMKRSVITLQPDTDEDTVTKMDVFTWGKSTRFTVRDHEVNTGRYPNWRALMGSADEDQYSRDTLGVMIAENRFDPFRKARRSASDQLIVEFKAREDGTAAMTRVRIGEYGVGIIMGVRTAPTTTLDILGIK